MRTPLAERTLPNYSIGEERFNMISHIVGGALGAVALLLCVIKAAGQGDGYSIAAAIVYGITTILLYTMSSVYHGLPHGMAKKVMQVLDHCAIYLLIAGTYTPVALGALRRESPLLGWIVFGVIWGLAAMATVFTAIDLKKYQLFSMICYIGMGWGVVLVWKQVLAALTFNGFVWLLIGGVMYTIGAALYAAGKRKKYMHNVFHVFVLLGSIAHFFAVYLYAL